MKLSVVIPVYNEADSIRDLLVEVCRTLDDELDYEVIVVDDGSSDNTPSVLQGARDDLPRLRVLRQTRRCGAGGEERAGSGRFRMRQQD